MFGKNYGRLRNRVEDEDLPDVEEMDKAAQALLGMRLRPAKGLNTFKVYKKGRKDHGKPEDELIADLLTAAPAMYLTLRLVKAWFRQANEGTLQDMIDAQQCECPWEAVRAVEDLIIEKGDYRCDNCEILVPYSKLDPIKDFSERVNAGGRVPVGQCPDCGALCYQVSGPDISPKIE